MKPVLALVMALVCLGGAAGAASAQPWGGDHGRGHGHHGGNGGGRWSEGGRGRAQDYSDNRGRGHGRSERSYGAPPGRVFAPGGRGRGYDAPVGRPVYAAPRRSWSRGQYLPRSYVGNGLDYRRYNLRRPPPGYAWVRADSDYVLMSTNSGLILDVIPGGF